MLSVREALAAVGFAARIAADAERRSAEHDWPLTPRPAGGFAESPAFAAGTPPADALAAALDRVATLVWGTRPSFEECLERIRGAAHLL